MVLSYLKQSLLKHEWSILYFLLSLSDQQEFVSTVIFLIGEHFENLPKNTLSKSGLNASMVQLGLGKIDHQNNSEKTSSLESLPVRESRMRPMQPFSNQKDPVYNGYYLINDKNISRPHLIVEMDILRDLLYVFQGIDGRFLKFDARSDAFLLDYQVVLPRPTVEITHKLSELGWLYFKIQKQLQVKENLRSLGLVGQVC
jgi:gamma-tubulin complex component 3